MCNQFSLENRALLHKILPNPSMANFITRILLRSQNFQNTTLPLSAQCVMVHVSTLRQFWEKWHGWNQGYPNMALTLPFISQMVWIWAMTHKETMDLWVIIVCHSRFDGLPFRGSWDIKVENHKGNLYYNFFQHSKGLDQKVVPFGYVDIRIHKNPIFCFMNILWGLRSIMTVNNKRGYKNKTCLVQLTWP